MNIICKRYIGVVLFWTTMLFVMFTGFAYSAIPSSERAVLITLYNSTNGNNWTDNTGWKGNNNEPDGFSQIGSEGTWYGITVDADTVIRITLWNNNLTGNIPPALGNLTHLNWLSLYGNNLSGTIPPGLGKYCNSLDLRYNNLSGTIPPEILYGHAEGVGRDLYLAHNNLSGSIPPFLAGSGTFHSNLDLSFNRLSGSLPPSLFKDNMFLGDPSILDLSNNNLEGYIPPEIGDCFMVCTLNLSNNRFSGSIPKEMGNFAYNPDIDLSGNLLSGEVPMEFWNLPSGAVDISSNILSGVIPADMVKWYDRPINIGYNSFMATDGNVIAYLNTNDPDWAETQTILPTNISAAFMPSSSIRVSWTPILYTADPGGYRIYSSLSQFGPWTQIGVTASKSDSYYDVTGLAPGTTYYFRVRAFTNAHPKNKSVAITGFSDVVSASTVYVPPSIAINRTQFYFGAVTGKAVPVTQSFSVGNSGGSVLNWSATSNKEWLHANPSSGSGWGLVNITVDISGLSTGTYEGTIMISSPTAVNSPQTVSVQLVVKFAPQDQTPFGYFETPAAGAVVSGSIPVTGWALDDIGVESVKIYRDAPPGESTGLIYIGDAVFVEGARPDVETAYPGYPMNYKAGWGYMLLTNFLPGQGNGTFTLHAIARDTWGSETTLGTKTITCDNAHAVKPFGAIDTPTQGGVVSGKNYLNFGWALTPLPNTIPLNGSTITLWVDGKQVGHPVYNQYREDVATLFPGLNNSNGAVGYYYLDTTKYANGTHTISWSVKDNAGNEDGIGSRYFSTQDSGQNSINKGFNDKTASEEIIPDENGVIRIEVKELERVEINLSDKKIFEGYLIVGDQLRALPIGSTLDKEKGIFYWQPGPGFVGDYRFEFLRKDQNGVITKKRIEISIGPRSVN